MKNFNDFFDVHNIEHLLAYKHLSMTGVWPKDFVPDDCEISHLWISHIQSRMADAYVEFKIKGE
jgi:hypothetical protein